MNNDFYRKNENEAYSGENSYAREEGYRDPYGQDPFREPDDFGDSDPFREPDPFCDSDAFGEPDPFDDSDAFGEPDPFSDSSYEENGYQPQEEFNRIFQEPEYAPVKKRLPVRPLIILLSFVLVINVITFMNRLKNEVTGGYSYEYSDMYRSMEQKDYPEIRRMLMDNKHRGSKAVKDTQEFEYLVDLHSALILEHAYNNAGETEKALEMHSYADEQAAQITDSTLQAQARELMEQYR